MMLIVFYLVIAFVIALLGVISVISEFYGHSYIGHYNKMRFLAHVAVAIIGGMLWPVLIMAFLFELSFWS